jgi:DNA-binding SARP family transcriptional activator/predicted ATPase
MDQSKLTISLLGGVTISLDGTVITGFPSRKADALLAYLACHPHTHPREKIAALFWPENDQTRALANLSVILSSLRKKLGDYLVTDRHTVAFNQASNYQLDVVVFEEAISISQSTASLTRTNAIQLQTAVSLYKGEFMAGFYLRNVPDFEAWMLLEQERYRQQMISALNRLITFYEERGFWLDGIQTAQRLLSIDPLHEETHRLLMRLYVQDNQRAAALLQYEQCCAVLQEELGVAPDEATTALYQQIQRNDLIKGDSEGRQTVLRAPAHNMTQATTPFVGREAELAQIEQWLQVPSNRLLTILGAGGMGKTRLAQEAARYQIGAFADGVWFVSMVPQTNLNEMMVAISDTIGLSLSGNEPIADQLHQQLQPRELLLILDNLEHLLSAELRHWLSRLIQEAPELRVIVTSRERLNLQAEQLLELQGLDFPKGRSGEESGLSEYGAIQLFVNSVQRHRSEIDWAAEKTAVIQLCQLTEGMPLALELAATWMRILSVNEVLVEIQSGLAGLTTTLHDVPARHQSLQTVIEASWHLLSAEDKQLFTKLAVFRGGFTRAMAQKITDATLPQLLSLVDRSFLRLDADQRFRRHPLLLQFAQKQLASYPDKEARTAAKHAQHFAEFATALLVELKGEGAEAALAALGTEIENIRAAWRWSLELVEEPLLTPITLSLSRFFTDRSRYMEGLAMFEDGLAFIENQKKSAVTERITCRIQVELGFYYYQTGHYARAETVLLEANSLAEKHGLIESQISCLKHLGDVLSDQGDRERSRQFLARGLSLFQTASFKDPFLEMAILNAAGNLEVGAGNYDIARTYFNRAMDLAKQENHPLRIAILHNNIAIIANREEKFTEAIQQYKLARDGFQKADHKWGIAATTHNIGMIYAELEEYEQAFAHVQEAYLAHETIGHRRGMVGGLAFLGTISFKTGKRGQARRYFYDSIQLAQAVGVTWSIISTLVDVAELEMSYGRWEPAGLFLSFCIAHPAIEYTTLERAQRLLDELLEEHPGIDQASLQTNVANLNLDDIVSRLSLLHVG